MPSFRPALPASALALAVFLAAPVFAQDAAAVSSDSEPAIAAQTARFLEARAAGDWTRALAAYDDLVERSPALAKDTRLTLERARVLHHVGRRLEAANLLEGLLEVDADNVVAIYLLATID